jgi:hypothetical protein
MRLADNTVTADHPAVAEGIVVSRNADIPVSSFLI